MTCWASYNANEVPTQLWNKNRFHRSLHNTAGMDHFRSTRWTHKPWCRMKTATTILVHGRRSRVSAKVAQASTDLCFLTQSLHSSCCFLYRHSDPAQKKIDCDKATLCLASTGSSQEQLDQTILFMCLFPCHFGHVRKYGHSQVSLSLMPFAHMIPAQLPLPCFAASYLPMLNYVLSRH